jgi:hypothetical protein
VFIQCYRSHNQLSTQSIKLILLGKLHDAIAEKDFRYLDISVQKSIDKDNYELVAKLLLTVKFSLPEESLAPPSPHCLSTKSLSMNCTVKRQNRGRHTSLSEFCFTWSPSNHQANRTEGNSYYRFTNLIATCIFFKDHNTLQKT